MTVSFCKLCRSKDAIVILTEGTWGSNLKCSSCGNVGEGYKEDDLASHGGFTCSECFGNCDIYMFESCTCPCGHPPCSACTDAGVKCNDCETIFDREGEIY